MTTSVIWGVIAFLTIARVKYNGPESSWEAKYGGSGNRNVPTKEYLENIILSPCGVTPDLNSEEFKKGSQRAKETFERNKKLQLIASYFISNMLRDENGLCSYFTELEEKYRIFFNCNDFPWFFHHDYHFNANYIAGFNSEMFMMIKSQYGDDVFQNAYNESLTRNKKS